eukprot:7386902-Prymnesium_polylepis.1
MVTEVSQATVDSLLGTGYDLGPDIACASLPAPHRQARQAAPRAETDLTAAYGGCSHLSRCAAAAQVDAGRSERRVRVNQREGPA